MMNALMTSDFIEPSEYLTDEIIEAAARLVPNTMRKRQKIIDAVNHIRHALMHCRQGEAEYAIRPLEAALDYLSDYDISTNGREQ